MKKSFVNYVILMVLALIWGSSFILMKRGLEVYSYSQVAALRLLIASISLFPFVFFALKKVKRKEWVPLLISAVFGNGFPAFLFAKAQTQLDSSFIGILNSLTPLFTLMLAIMFFKLKPTRANILGIVIGFIGAIYLTVFNWNIEIPIDKYVLYIVLATFFYAISINVIKYYLSELGSIHISALTLLFVGPPMGIYIFNTDFMILVQNSAGVEALVFIVILAVVGTSFAIVLFNQLLKKSSAIFASSVTYLIPIVAIVWGILDAENILTQHIIGATIIFLGIYLANKK